MDKRKKTNDAPPPKARPRFDCAARGTSTKAGDSRSIRGKTTLALLLGGNLCGGTGKTVDRSAKELARTRALDSCLTLEILLQRIGQTHRDLAMLGAIDLEGAVIELLKSNANNFADGFEAAFRATSFDLVDERERKLECDWICDWIFLFGHGLSGVE